MQTDPRSIMVHIACIRGMVAARTGLAAARSAIDILGGAVALDEQGSALIQSVLVDMQTSQESLAKAIDESISSLEKLNDRAGL